MVKFIYRFPGKSWGSFMIRPHAIEAVRRRYLEEGAIVRFLL